LDEIVHIRSRGKRLFFIIEVHLFIHMATKLAFPSIDSFFGAGERGEGRENNSTTLTIRRIARHLTCINKFSWRISMRKESRALRIQEKAFERKTNPC
jgi:hypothetical protein